MSSPEEPPVKRRRLSQENASRPGKYGLDQPLKGNSGNEDKDHVQRESRAGITAFVHPNTPGFTGVLKTRYTDFLVNEILPNGKVLHLKNLKPPRRNKTSVSEPDHLNAASNNVEPNGGTGEAVLIAKQDENSQNPTTGDSLEIVESEISQENLDSLFDLFSDQVTEKIVDLYKAVLNHPTRKAKEFRSVKSGPITDKQRRTEAHQTIRRIFQSKLETTTSNDDTILISAMPGKPSARGGMNGSQGPRTNRQSWEDLGGLYVHFTLYKENRDTMESISFLASQLRVAPKHFQFGGTKDRRAVTVQRCSVYRVHAEQLTGVGKRLHGSKIGDYEYHRTGLELGDLGGNEFVITLRDCHVAGDENMGIDERVSLAQKSLPETVEAFKQGGFINYYGLQRFGSFTTKTDEVGIKLLQGDLEAAVEAIFAFNPSSLEEDPSILISSDDRARSQAITIWNSDHDSSKALSIMPKKFSAETNIIRHLGSRNPKTGAFSSLRDYQGALKTIPRNLRLMYVHAYQSMVWNIIAGKRWDRYGPKVVEGDLVMISEHASRTKISEAPTIDEQGEPIILPTAADGTDVNSSNETPYEQARPLTAEEATSGDYSIFDVVLPLPGFDVVYPNNDIGEDYKTFMASEEGGELDPYNMRRSWKDLSLSGSYRKLLGRPGEGMRFEVKTYVRDEEQLVETDLDRLNAQQQGDKEQAGDGANTGHSEPEVESEQEHVKKMAIILWMKLAPSQYATMALRELMKAGGVQTFKPEYGVGR